MKATVDAIYREKQLRRRALSRLSFGEKIEIIEQLRSLALTLRRARQGHRHPGRVVFFKPAPACVGANRWETSIPMTTAPLTVTPCGAPSCAPVDPREQLAA